MAAFIDWKWSWAHTVISMTELYVLRFLQILWLFNYKYTMTCTVDNEVFKLFSFALKNIILKFIDTVFCRSLKLCLSLLLRNSGSCRSLFYTQSCYSPNGLVLIKSFCTLFEHSSNEKSGCINECEWVNKACYIKCFKCFLSNIHTHASQSNLGSIFWPRIFDM